MIGRRGRYNNEWAYSRGSIQLTFSTASTTQSAPLTSQKTGKLRATRSTTYPPTFQPRIHSLTSNDSYQLHRAIVSPMNPEARLTILFDCCHSGSACELPYVYRPDADGNINLMDQLKKGAGLVRAAHQLIQGGWSREKMSDAKMLLGGATDFFNGLHHLREGEADGDGLAPENFHEHWEREGKDVWMFSGCRDDQTSADATISGAATGAMSWAFIGTMRENPELSYVDVCVCPRAVPVAAALGTDNWIRSCETPESVFSTNTPRSLSSVVVGSTILTSLFV